MSEYTDRSTPIAIGLLTIDIVLLTVFTWFAVSSEHVVLKILFAILAGDRISALFVIGHDAAHGAYTDHKRLNQTIGRIAFLPALHNYSLWQIAHNRKHHRYPNLKGLNSWSPLSKAEYDDLPKAKKLLERFYRTAIGLGPYYILNRWLPDKLFPRRKVVEKMAPVYWVDFAVIVLFLASVLVGLAYLGSLLPTTTPAQAILWGYIIPFIVWNYLMGFGIYLQHTNTSVPWFDSKHTWRRIDGQHDVTCHVVFPRWFNFMTHNIMEHTAHHIHPKIPFYRISEAQRALAETLGERFVVDKFTMAWFLKTMRACKLYDYERQRWLDFEGNPGVAGH